MYSKCSKKDCQPRIPYPAKLSFKIGEIRTFPDEQKLSRLINCKLVLQKILKRLSGLNEKSLESNPNLHEKRKITGKGNYIYKYKM